MAEFDPHAYAAGQDEPAAAFDPVAYASAPDEPPAAPAPQEHGLPARAAHYAAHLLPAAGAVAGGALGAGAGAALGFPTTGPGGVATTMAGGAIGAGLGTGAGESAKHAIDLALGYEKPAPFVDVAKDIGKEAATTAGLSAAGEMAAPLVMKIPGVKRTLQAVPDALEAAGGKLKDLAVNAGRRVLTGGASLNNSMREPLAREAVEAALDSGAIKPFGTTGGAADRLDVTRKALGDQYARIIGYLKTQGIEGPNAQALAQKMVAEGRSISAGSLTDAVPNLYQKTGESLATKPTLASGNLDLKQAEDMKRSLFDEARYGRYEETPLNEAKRDLGSMVKTANEDAIKRQMPGASPTTQAIGAQFEPIKDKLGNIIAASDVADIGAGRAANRVALSPRSVSAGVISAASGGGLPASTAATLLTHQVLNRGASTVATGANAGGSALKSAAQKLQAIVSTNPAQLGRYGAILSRALSEGQQSFDAHAYALGQIDPEFQELHRKLGEEGTSP